MPITPPPLSLFHLPTHLRRLTILKSISRPMTRTTSLTSKSFIARQSKNKELAEVPILSLAPTPAKSVMADRTVPDSPARRKGKAPAGRTVSRHALPTQKRKSSCTDLPRDREDTRSSLLIVMMTTTMQYQ
ncbi:hypothetical protein GQ457_15G018600 [Hibiscus cannabinus]